MNAAFSGCCPLFFPMQFSQFACFQPGHASEWSSGGCRAILLKTIKVAAVFAMMRLFASNEVWMLLDKI